jgi:hypothetical protein
LFAECTASVRAFERAVSTLDEGVVRDRLHSLGAQLPPLLAVAERLAGAIADEAAGGAAPLEERLVGLRAALRGMASDCERIAVLLRADPGTPDLGDQLSALGAGLAEARRHSWTPIAPAPRA